MSDPREKCLIISRILKKTNKPQTLIGVMQEVVRFDPKLNTEERNMLTRAYKTVINERRDSLRVVNAAVEKETIGGTSLAIGKLRTLKNKIISELTNLCHEFIELIDNKLLPNAIDLPAKIYYFQVKADVLRYLCESGDIKEKTTFITKATESYNKALGLVSEAIETYPKFHPVSLRLTLNYSVFLFEIVNKKDEALSLLESTFSECTKDQENPLPQDIFSETHMLLQLILDNLTIWQKGKTE